MIDIRQPNITGKTATEQLAQIRSYLYQFAGQLQWALNTMDSGGGIAAGTVSVTKSGQEDAKVDYVATFNNIKGLIIKSADIVEAYYEKINMRLEGQYVAQSKFGTYAEQTSQQIEANSTSIEQVFSDLQAIYETIEGIESKTLETNAYIKSGLLFYDEDGLPKYGLEIGQTNTVDGVDTFDKFARFTSDRLSFYDNNDTEVAYISDYKLVITNAEIKGTLKLGEYEIDTTDGLAFKYVGRG